MMADTETVHFWRLTRQANHHPGQSDTKEVIDTKSMSKPGSVTTSKVETTQVATATIDLSYTRFQEERIDSKLYYIKYLRRLILLWNYGPPHPVLGTLKGQGKAPEVQLSNARYQLWRCLISNNHQPVRPWSMTTNCDNREDKKAPPWQPQRPWIPQTFQTSSPVSRSHYSQCPATTTINENLSLNTGKTEYQAGFVTMRNFAISRRPQMATIRWLTWKDNYKIQVNDLHPILSLIDKQDRKQTD
jgi:hypothetical protein